MPINNIYQNLASILRDIKGAPVLFGRELPRGTIITFRYSAWKHDPNPIVIVTKAIRPFYGQAGMIQGININYLVFNYFRRTILKRCGDTTFSYRNIINNLYLRTAFRRYKWTDTNIQNMMYFDCNAIKQKAKGVDAFDPSQVKPIKDYLKEQLAQPVNQPKAAQMPQPGIAPIAPQPATGTPNTGQ